MPDEITTGELGRRLDFIERMIDRRFQDVAAQLRDMQFVHTERYVADMGALQARVDSLEEYAKDNEESKKKVIGWIVTGAILPIIVVIILQLLQLN